MSVRFELLANFRRAPALPDNGVVNRPACLFIPDNGGFPLVCDSDCRDLFDWDSRLEQDFGHDSGL